VSTNLDEYRQQLVVALRTYHVPAARIGEAVAEVESHLADTGEDPVDAFGEPDEYARALSRSGTGRARASRWTNFVVGVVAFGATAVATSALLNGRWLPAAGAALAIAVLGGWLYLTRDRHRIVDPRTGGTLRLPVPRWAFVVMAVAVAGLLATGLLL
jgi:hypothetical protein